MSDAEEVIAPERRLHVFPDYGRDHALDEEGLDCWCSPSVELVKGKDGLYGEIVIHREVN